MDHYVLKSKGCGCCDKFLPPRVPVIHPTHEFSPAYRNFWQNQFVAIPNGQNIPFNNESIAAAGGIVLLPPATIFIPLAGDYEISFVVTSFVSTAANREQQVTAILNGVPVPGFQASFGTINEIAERCDQFSGTAILRVPAKSTFSLRNTSLNGSSISLCNLVESGASLIIKKLN
ncbi:BclA C-terminal domain-containing protein [Bacillus luti]|uniref:BclA C-terminal domain-containing protein n=1 Tax=Bacillus luti TaxID=2026191 RepID=UPI003D000F48